MIRFYLNGNEVKVSVAPQISTTEDQTLDSASVVLQANTNPHPIAPMQLFKIVFEDNNYLLFYVAADEVSIFSMNPLTYSHKLTLTQNIRKLSKHLLRNTSFTQPPAVDKIAYTSKSFVLRYTKDGEAPYNVPRVLEFTENIDETGKVYNWIEPINITDREKTASVWYRIKSTFFNNITAGWDSSLVEASNVLEYVKSVGGGFKFYVKKGDKQQEVNVIDEAKDLNQKTYSSELTEFFKANGSGSYEITMDKELEFKVPLTEPYPESAKDLPTTAPFFMSIEIEVGVDTYYYSAYDVLNIINKQYKQRAYNGIDKRQSLYNLPESGDLHDLLVNTIAPNFTFTQSTVFEAVSEVFKLFDAVFTLDDTNTLGIEFLNETSREKINTQFIGKTTGQGEEKYNQGFISYYQNALLKETYPASTDKHKKFAPARSTILGVPSKDNWSMILPHNIDLITRVYIRAGNIVDLPLKYNNLTTKVNCTQGLLSLDITPFVIESSLWSIINTSDGLNPSDYREKRQKYSISYSKGSNYINLSSFYQGLFGIEYVSLWNVIQLASLRKFGRASTFGSYEFQMLFPADRDWGAVKMSVEYLTTLDGRIQIESETPKYNGEMLMNQGSGKVDINKLGLNVLGLTYKLGEPTLSMNQKSTTWANAIKKGQIYIDENNEKWVANVCNYTIYNNFVLTNVQFVKNFNGLSQRIQIDRQKRLTAISRELAVKSEDNYCEYMYLSSEPIEETYEDIALAGDVEKLKFVTMVGATFGIDCDIFVDYARLTTYWSTKDKSVYLPMVKYGSGNALCFEMAMDDPISAGTKTTIETGWFGENKYFTQIVPYTDNNGIFTACDIFFESAAGINELNSNFPDLYNVPSNAVGSLTNYEYYKKSNEIFALNYEVICLTMPNRKDIDFIGQKFITENGLIKGVNAKKFYLYYANDGYKYSILDTKGHGTSEEISLINAGISNDKCTISFEFTPLLQGDNWSICDEQGNIYFASNSRVSDLGEQIIYFITHKDRL